MIVIGGLLILAVIVDGVRRMVQERRNSIRYSRRKAQKPIPADPEEEELIRNPELPSGRARVRTRDDFDLPPLTDESPDDEPEHSVPVLMDTVFQRGGADRREEPLADDGDESDELPSQEELFASLAEEAGAGDREEEAGGGFADVIVINVMARSGFAIPGQKLLETLLACDVRFGDMDIFHRYGREGQRRFVLFSIANLVEPGTFDLDRMDEFSTPGICMFMRLPGPPDPQEAFHVMLETARVLSEQLDADLYDDQHCKLRQQSLEHMRERIVEFRRKRLARS
jgi:cell division protein ZipA